jgi:hypothetical protein
MRQQRMWLILVTMFQEQPTDIPITTLLTPINSANVTAPQQTVWRQNIEKQNPNKT